MLKANRIRISKKEMSLMITKIESQGEEQSETKTKKERINALYSFTSFNPLPSQELF
jgi:hypothetical protein